MRTPICESLRSTLEDLYLWCLHQHDKLHELHRWIAEFVFSQRTFGFILLEKPLQGPIQCDRWLLIWFFSGIRWQNLRFLIKSFIAIGSLLEWKVTTLKWSFTSTISIPYRSLSTTHVFLIDAYAVFGSRITSPALHFIDFARQLNASVAFWTRYTF